MSNRIVAVFDNDTEGQATFSQLPKLPKNVKAMMLPELELAKSYPTLGPQGEVNLDINGKACSIELYLGRDILSHNGILTPIQWTGYHQKLKQYQGEILNKNTIQEKFHRTLQHSTSDTPQHDWTGTDLIWQNIFTTLSIA